MINCYEFYDLLMLFNLLFVDTLYKPNINADAKPIYCFLLKFVLKVTVLSAVFLKKRSELHFDEKICKFYKKIDGSKVFKKDRRIFRV